MTLCGATTDRTLEIGPLIPRLQANAQARILFCILGVWSGAGASDFIYNFQNSKSWKVQSSGMRLHGVWYNSQF
jgi:hypothetical protein